MYKSIDLFAGCGGLTLGLHRAGFENLLGIEKSPMAAETYYHNFVKRLDEGEWARFLADHTTPAEQAEHGVVVGELASVLTDKSLLERLRAHDIDLVAGGPPCQGFSLAGRRNPDDIRNQLPWEFLDFVEATDPKGVIIENVSGMTQAFKKHGKPSPFMELRDALVQTGSGYVVQAVHLNAKHFGAPQHRPRVMLIGIRADMAKAAGIVAHEHIWRSEYDHVPSVLFSKRPDLAPLATHFGEDILTVADAITDLSDKGYRRLSNLPQYAEDMRTETVPVETTARKGLANHNLRNHAEHIETRFRLYQYFRDNGVTTKILGIPKDTTLTEEGKKTLIQEALSGAKLPARGGDKTVIAKDLKSLVEIIMALGTKKHSQRSLAWTSPSPTVVSLPDDYVHPERPRTLTVREMARFQSFPDSFEFRSKETTGSHRRRFEVPQYTQVGNAVPPRLGRAVGEVVFDVLERAHIQLAAKAAG